MSEKEIQRDLEELRQEIAALETTKARLERLALDIEKRLADPEDSEHHTKLIESLRDAVTELEAAHPAATAMINRFLVTLSNMGI